MAENNGVPTTPELLGTQCVCAGCEKLLEKLIEFANLVKECPSNSVHLLPLAADALLRQLHDREFY